MQIGQEFSDRRVGIGNLAIVGRVCIPGFERLRRIVGIVRIVEMEPEKEGARATLFEPSLGSSHNLVSPAFDALVPVLSRTAVEAGIVEIEATIETRRGSLNRIKDYGRHERGSAITTRM